MTEQTTDSREEILRRLVTADGVLRRQAELKRETVATLREMADGLERSAIGMERAAVAVSGSGNLNREWDQSMFESLIRALNRGDLDSVDLETLEDTVQLARLARREMRR